MDVFDCIEEMLMELEYGGGMRFTNDEAFEKVHRYIEREGDGPAKYARWRGNEWLCSD